MRLPTRTTPGLPRLVVPGDQVVARMGVLTWTATLVAMACATALLLMSGTTLTWWKWALVALLLLPAIRPGLVTTSIAIGDFLLVWLILWPGLGFGLSVAVFGVHTGVAGWLLACSVPSYARMHRSALRTLLLRWGWIQLVCQVASVIAVLTRTLTDTLVAGAGMVALIVVVLAVAYWGLSPGRQKAAPRDRFS